MYIDTKQHYLVATADLAANTLLFLDFGLILYASPNRLEIMKRWYSIMDFFALICIFIFDIFDQMDLLFLTTPEVLRFSVGFTGVVYCFRIVRILRVFSHTKGMVALYMTVVANCSMIGFFLASFISVATISASVMYHTELYSNDFHNLFSSLWWAVVTISSVGYGDMIPETVPGKVLTVLIISCGLLLVAIPFVIITANYSNYYVCYENIIKHVSQLETSTQRERREKNLRPETVMAWTKNKSNCSDK